MTTRFRWLHRNVLGAALAILVTGLLATTAACSGGGGDGVRVVVEGGCSGEMTPDRPSCPPGSACDENGDCVTSVNTGYCEQDDDCPPGNVCLATACVNSGGCDVDADCEEGQICSDGSCRAP